MNKPPQNLREELGVLGLNDREAKVYLALLEAGNLTATQIAVATRIPQNKVYTPLESLVQSGFCQRQKHGRQRIYSAVDPALALAEPLNNLEARVQEARSLQGHLTEVFAAVRPVERDLTEVEILDTPEAIKLRYSQLLEATREDIVGFARGPFAFTTAKEWDRIFDEARKMSKHCQARWVYELRYPRDQELAQFLAVQKDIGELRVSGTLPLKMVIFDRRTVLFTDENPDKPQQLQMAVIHHPTVAKAFLLLFDSLWQQATSLTAWLSDQK